MHNAADFNERRDTAAKAKRDMLAKFQARPAADDPAVLERQAALKALHDARERRATERKALRAAEAARLAAEQAAERAAQQAREAEQTAREAALRLAQKAARDARYAARKARR